ncbi:uncharacterized protein LOC143877524 isoform X5 [Tasmannia lanceolata]|uniref:uncharacterized protein LOC143877524 isoform X5 n=1 Tax=Tasmannia lanceolata TaxID=3420 RepID=UPI0040636C3F
MPYAETWTDAFNYAFIELMRDLRGVALATDWCPRMHELLSDRIFPTHTPLLLRAISYFSGTPDDIYLIPGSRIPVREERVTVEVFSQIPGSWRPVLEDCTTLQIYFDHYEITKPPLSKECRVQTQSSNRIRRKREERTKRGEREGRGVS